MLSRCCLTFAPVYTSGLSVSSPTCLPDISPFLQGLAVRSQHLEIIELSMLQNLQVCVSEDLVCSSDRAQEVSASVIFYLILQKRLRFSIRLDGSSRERGQQGD